MGLDTNAQVERINVVQDSQGNDVAPATEQSQKALQAALGNQDSLTAFEYSTGGTTEESLTTHPVPDGVEVLLYAKDGNSDFVWIGDDTSQPIPLKQGGSLTLAVSDTAAIYVQTPTAGDTVGVLFEDA